MTQGTLRVNLTLGDMAPEEAFTIDVPRVETNVSVVDLIDQLFPPSVADIDAVRLRLDTRTYPDLPEIYDMLSGMFDHWRAGTSRMTFRTPAGADVDPALLVSCLVAPESCQEASSSVDRSLQLVLENRFDALAAYELDGGDREGFAGWMRACALIYFLDKHRFVLPTTPSDDLYAELLRVANPLVDRGLIAPSPGGNMLEISEDGRSFIGELMDEAEAYIDAFDAFSDVSPSRGQRPVEFAAGSGFDLRVQVFDAQSIDAYRAVFLLRLYDGSLDGFRSEWRKCIPDDDFLNWIIEPAVDHDWIDDDELADIVEAEAELRNAGDAVS